MDYSKMSVEELFDEYYWARIDISYYNDGLFVFSHDKEKNEKMLQERYNIMYNAVEEVKSRIEKDDE